MITWVVLTLGDRPRQLSAAIASIRAQARPSDIVVVVNGGDGPDDLAAADDLRIVQLDENIGVPGGRHEGVRASDTAVIAFLDDDAALITPDANERIEQAFVDHPTLGALSFRIRDEDGGTQRRHIPRAGAGGANTAGPSATFLGGASAIARQAYDDAGGYWGELYYAHEELDLSWRLHDCGYQVRYAPDIVVEHPKTPIGRHPRGWYLTGRNRVMVARRNLPAPVAALHVLVWLVLGALRAPDSTCRHHYLSGWRSGWSARVVRRPIAWATVTRLARSGRPPIV